jgi:8-amino-7-oxononanoate synthase
MADFSSALYLGFEHGSGSLPGWTQLTPGKPAALEEVPGTRHVQRELAVLTGCERVVPGASTLHLFNDLFGMLASRNDIAIWIDEAAYPIARWGTDRAAASGVPVRVFARHDAEDLWKAMNASRGARPVIVTDGFCPMRGEPAPLADYVRCAAAGNGLLIVDDTQALGVFGRPDEPGPIWRWRRRIDSPTQPRECSGNRCGEFTGEGPGSSGSDARRQP